MGLPEIRSTLCHWQCGKYVGDSDGACPNLVCVRGREHPGLCDNASGDHQVWGWDPNVAAFKPFPVSYAYSTKASAQRVLLAAQRLLPSLVLSIVSSDETIERGFSIEYTEGRCFFADEAEEMFRRFGW